MFGGRGRGRGRGRGPAGAGGGRSGPRIPNKLSKELFGEQPSGGGTGGSSRGQPPRKERRKEEREARHGRGGGGRGGSGRDGGQGGGRDGSREPPSHAAQASGGKQQREQRQDQPSKGGSGAGGRGAHSPAAKRQRLSGPSAAAAPASNFEQLLPAHLQGEAAGRDPEAELQLALARKLGLKKGKTQMAEEDGLDELLEELGGIDELFDSDEEGAAGAPAAAAAAATAAGRKRKQQQAAAAPSDSSGGGSGGGGSSDEDMDGMEGVLGSGSDEDGEEESEEESGSQGSEDDDSLLEGLHPDDDEDGDSEEDGSVEGSGEESPDDDGEPGAAGQQQRQGGPGDEEEDSSGEEDLLASSGEEEEQQRAAAPAAAVAAGKYVPPAARRAAAAAGASAGGPAAGGGVGSEAAARVERRVRGLLNRLTDANIQGIVTDLTALYGQEGRRLVSDAVCAELISAAADGPRASDHFAAVTATAVAGLAGSVRTSEVVANFVDRLAGRLEAARASGDTLCCHNLVMVASHLYLAGALKPDMVYSVLDSWRQRFSETDVSMIVTLLHACGLQLRAGDPVAMKEFVVAVHARAGEVGGAGQLTKRAQMLLELVVDVKNNRRREEAKHKAVALPPAVAKWLKASGAADMALSGISWQKVLQPHKKGIWWMPEAADAQPQHLAGSAAALRAAAAGGEGGLAGPELLKLAAALRMNTDVRRAVFCVVMGSEDCLDAVEKLLRLGLKGEQEREVVRVTVECCLQEKAWNAYYAHLLLRLSGVGKSHKMTLQYCLWDQLKEVAAMEVRRLTNLARLMATVLVSGALPSTMLKVVDFSDALSAREVLFWRVFFEHLLASCKTPADSAAFFKRITAVPDLKPMRTALAAFLRRSVGPWLAAKQPGASGLSAEQLGELLRRLRGAERALGAPP